MSNIEIPFENPTFKENTSHIHTNIDTSKLKPDSNDDTLHFSKIAVLEAKFDALKSLVTREISNLANKLDYLSLVLNETSKTLEKLDYYYYHYYYLQLVQRNKITNKNQLPS